VADSPLILEADFASLTIPDLQHRFMVRVTAQAVRLWEDATLTQDGELNRVFPEGEAFTPVLREIATRFTGMDTLRLLADERRSGRDPALVRLREDGYSVSQAIAGASRQPNSATHRGAASAARAIADFIDFVLYRTKGRISSAYRYVREAVADLHGPEDVLRTLHADMQDILHPKPPLKREEQRFPLAGGGYGGPVGPPTP
jgi:hypothetical protein